MARAKLEKKPTMKRWLIQCETRDPYRDDGSTQKRQFIIYAETQALAAEKFESSGIKPCFGYAMIRKLIGDGHSQGSVARSLGVSGSTIHYVIRGKTWKHL